jgi:glycerol-3-phosphate dehydrogenase
MEVAMSRLRATNLQQLAAAPFDVLVVGAGINGAVSAASLAARGVRVALIDRGDFASQTSQESSNLAWGGIKYMETFEFGLVRKLCVSRNHLIRTYPSTVKEIRFFALHPKGFRHGLWKLFAGTLLYWAIGSFFTRLPRLLTKKTIAREEPIVALDDADGGFEYSDAYLHDNDARFVWNFVRGALDHGCIAANYVEATAATKSDDGWSVTARDVVTGAPLAIRARVVINACGPWVDALNQGWGRKTDHRHVFSKGIHLVVPRLTQHRRVLTFFADDGRLFFAIPMGPRTCIGTTDTRVEAPETFVTDADRRFVLDNINKRLRLEKPLTPDDVIAERCGVRPLVVKGGGLKAGVEWSQLSRKHVVEVDVADRRVSIFGGKLTDCLNVGEEALAAVKKLGVAVPYPDARWYGEAPEQTREEYFHQARLMRLDDKTDKSASEKLSTRLWRRYGGEALRLLETIRADPREGEILLAGTEYLRCELSYVAAREMIVKLEDFLRRRSKVALVVRDDEIRAASGLREACAILFGDEADARMAEYFAAERVPPVAVRAGRRGVTAPGTSGS